MKKKTKPAPENPPNGKKRRSSPNTSTSTSTSTSPDKKGLWFSQLGLSQDQHITLPSPIASIADRQKKVVRPEANKREKQPPSQFGGKQPRTNLHPHLHHLHLKNFMNFAYYRTEDRTSLQSSSVYRQQKHYRVPKKESCKSSKPLSIESSNLLDWFLFQIRTFTLLSSF